MWCIGNFTFQPLKGQPTTSFLPENATWHCIKYAEKEICFCHYTIFLVFLEFSNLTSNATDNLNFQVVGRPTFMFIMNSQKVFVWSAQATYAVK